MYLRLTSITTFALGLTFAASVAFAATPAPKETPLPAPSGDTCLPGYAATLPKHGIGYVCTEKTKPACAKGYHVVMAGESLAGPLDKWGKVGGGEPIFGDSKTPHETKPGEPHVYDCIANLK